MQLKAETNVKAEILTRGVVFSDKAIQQSIIDNAKGQNMVYNAPKNGEKDRPQELFLKGEDGYTTVVSCVSSHNYSSPVKVDISSSGKLACYIDGGCITEAVEVAYVPQPAYYSKAISNGDFAKQYVSACGYDELNIVPWKGCAISKPCKFCGANIVAEKNGLNILHARDISRNLSLWGEVREKYLKNLSESISCAIQSECYSEHMHVIIISGNLFNNLLNEQADIYCDIAQHVNGLVQRKSSEGIVAVMSPPEDPLRLEKLRDSGVKIVVFNLEAGNEPWFSAYCPGKSSLGRDYIISKLKNAVKVFGRGKVWTNFVLGLEPINPLLELCEKLANCGIVSSANVLHLDDGSRVGCEPPSKVDVITFFYELSKISEKYGFDAFYCSKALRTSLSNEMHDGRFF